MAYGAGIGWLAGAIGCTSDFSNTNDWMPKMETEKWGETPKAERRPNSDTQLQSFRRLHFPRSVPPHPCPFPQGEGRGERIVRIPESGDFCKSPPEFAKWQPPSKEANGYRR